MKWKAACWLFASGLTYAFSANVLAVHIDPDQVQGSGDQSFPLQDDFFWQQSVKAGESGLLSEVDVFYSGFLAGGFQLFLDTVLLSDPIDPSNPVAEINLGLQNPNWITIDVTSANFHVDAGSPVFYIGLLGLDPRGASTPFILGAQVGNPYEPGGLFLNGTATPDNMDDLTNADFRFRTYVEQSIPEPSSFLLLALGLAALGFFSSRFDAHCLVQSAA